jgi:hypothetical protein
MLNTNTIALIKFFALATELRAHTEAHGFRDLVSDGLDWVIGDMECDEECEADHRPGMAFCDVCWDYTMDHHWDRLLRDTEDALRAFQAIDDAPAFDLDCAPDAVAPWLCEFCDAPGQWMDDHDCYGTRGEDHHARMMSDLD